MIDNPETIDDAATVVGWLRASADGYGYGIGRVTYRDVADVVGHERAQRALRHLELARLVVWRANGHVIWRDPDNANASRMGRGDRE